MGDKTIAALFLSLFFLPLAQPQANDDACHDVVLTLIGYTQKTETQFLYSDGGCYDFRTRLTECNKDGKASERIVETPQYMWLRVAVGIHSISSNPASNLEFTVANSITDLAP